MVKGLWNYATKVADIDAVTDFYVKHMGAELRFKSQVLGCDFALIRIGTMKVILFDKAPYEEAMGWDLPIGFLHAVYEVDDFEQAVANIRDSGVQVLMEPTLIEHEGFGRRQIFFFISPDGIRTEVMEILEDAGRA